MALLTPTEEIKKYNSIGTHRSALDNRMDAHLDLFRMAPFKIPATEGEWESVTTNSPSVLGNKIIHLCSTANRRLFIPLTEDDKELERKVIGNTERLANGLISQGDFFLSQAVEELVSQEAMAFFGAIFGFIILRYVQLPGEGDDIIPDLACWYPRHTRWISGRRGLLWACHMRYAAPESIDEEYNVKATPDSYGRVAVYDMFDKDDEGICFGNGGDKWVDKQAHGLGRVPVGVFPVGSVPLLQSSNTNQDDLIKLWGQSIYVNNEVLYPILSRLLSYKLTKAGQEAKTPIVTEFDSTKGGKAVQMPEDPYVKGKSISLDVGKGQKIVSSYPNTQGNTITEALSQVGSEVSMGGMAPVAYGQIDQQLPAAGIISLLKASMERVYPVKKAMERAYAWLAGEVVKQYKDKDDSPKQIRIEGKDSKDKRYRSEISQDDVDTKWRFECDLALESSQMELEIAGILLPLIKAKFISYQTARERFPWITDPDLEQKIIDREQVYGVQGLAMRRVAEALKTDGDMEGFTFIMQDIEQAKQTALDGGGSNPSGGLPSPVNPAMLAGRRMQAPSPEDVRLNNLRLVRGR